MKRGLGKKGRRRTTRSEGGRRPLSGSGMTEQGGRSLILKGQPARERENARAIQSGLVNSRDHYAELFNRAPVAYLTLDRKGRILESNRMASVMLGVSRKTVLRGAFSAFVAEDSRKEWGLEYDALFSEGVQRSCDLEMRKADGSSATVRLQMEPVLSRRERRSHVVMIDITERVRSERRLSMENVSLRADVERQASLMSERRFREMAVARDVSQRRETERQLDQYRKDLRTMSLELMLAEERERQRLAQDLHDGLGQTLFTARLKLAEAGISGPVAQSLSAILEDIAKTVNTLTFELSPPILRLLGLGPAVRWLADDMKARYGLAVQVDGGNGPLPLGEDTAMVVFRIVRELLINVAKHAGVKLAMVSIRKGSSLKITVEDSGAGFDVTARSLSVEGGHFGLFSVRERLEYIGGAFKIESAPGAGTRASLTVPFAVKTASA
ncbi:MAG TPA: PAS domain-containing sensor histidine kinase [Terriglobia bacterium]|nr:PAS domain-containing sensor histidine kinase [Terriglobia bacterium]